MQKTDQLTIELPIFQMEIIKRAARYNRVSPEHFVRNQLNLESIEGWLNELIGDASQGYIAARVMVRCERCQNHKMLGAGATLCARCRYEFPEECADEAHQAFAGVLQPDNNKNFHCRICNKWVVREDMNLNEPTELELATHRLHMQRRYVVSLGEAPFNCLKFFVENFIAVTDLQLAARISDSMIEDHHIISGLNGLDIDELRDRLENFIQRCREEPSDDDTESPDLQTKIVHFIESASQAIEDINRSVRDQTQIEKPLSS